MLDGLTLDVIEKLLFVSKIFVSKKGKRSWKFCIGEPPNGVLLHPHINNVVVELVFLWIFATAVKVKAKFHDFENVFALFSTPVGGVGGLLIVCHS